MKKLPVLIALGLIAALGLLSSGISYGKSPCPGDDPGVYARAREDFRARMEYLNNDRGRLFYSFTEENPGITESERDALRFLLAYSPLCDLADMEPEYFLAQVRGAFRAREHFPWGATVTDDIFTHFVLPHRVNNENLDEARDVFFGELRERLAGLSMYEAALEVNHWCHEKVEYRATDPRTSAPLALVRTSWGRCGEESAFTATALRAVGIPARQVYTPRWVHTDSNHAWVEVWIDGRWYYLGACEPEPELDMAWFTTPATRAMMMHTTVFGKYAGPEEVNHRTDHYTVINLLSTYAPPREVKVRVEDAGGAPVPGATVKFKVYNYAELYPIVTLKTDTDGSASVTTGYGDLVVWVSNGDRYGYVKLDADTPGAVITLSGRAGKEYREDFVMNVPAARAAAGVESEKAAENRRRLAREDSIRNAYMATFAEGTEFARRLASQCSLPEDTIGHYLKLAQGNWEEIGSFISLFRNEANMLPLLASLSEKDLRDTPAAVLGHHLAPLTLPAYEVPDELYAAKILSPRIDMEIIAPWRGYLRDEVFSDPQGSLYARADTGGDSGGNSYRTAGADPQAIVEYVKENIRIDDNQNYVACLITPCGVHKAGVADRRSRNVFFVALCRTAGIPAHIDRATGKPQFWKDGLWHDALLDGAGAVTAVPETGTVTFLSSPSNPVEPLYRSHYTIARFEEGNFRTLDLAGELAGRGYPATATVPVGYYRYMAASRANDGSVAVYTEYFNLSEAGQRRIEVSLPELTDKLFVEGILDMNTVIFLPDGTKTTLKEQSNDKGLILIFVDPATEPTRHILQEMPAFARRLEEWGGGVLFVQPGETDGATFNRAIFGDLPAQGIWMGDGERALLESALESLRMDFTGEYPLTLYLNTSGGILFSHKGYRLSLVESLYKTITAEAATAAAL